MASTRSLSDVIGESARLLEEAGRHEARLKAELIASHAFGVPRLHLLADSQREISQDQLALQRALALRVARGEPLQYVLGEAWFWGCAFLSDRRALIPRPETEELVQRVLDATDLWQRAAPRLADVGTGTGCIALTLAAERPQARVLATDISAEALSLARANGERLGLAGRVEWRVGDLLEGVPADYLDAVVSNPPYIAASVIETLAEEVRAHEPRLALDGGPDGLEIVRRLASQAALALRGGGRLWMEIGDEQGESARCILAEAGFGAVRVWRDLSGQERIVEGQRA